MLGQFNKGFIICEHQGKVYMVDQHAASEKYHYETLLAKSQSLEAIKSDESQNVTSIEAD